MKKKSQIRNQRVNRMIEKMEIISKNDAIRLERQKIAEDDIIKAEKRKEEENRKRFFAQIADKSDFGSRKDTKFNNKHTKARATGLKSIFVLSDSVALITSYGRGWKSVPEKLISKETIIDLQDTKTLEVEKGTPSHMSVSGYLPDAVYVPNPLVQPDLGKNRNKYKAKLERQFFGSEYSDNIHIQVIYNILDIEKILSVYINHVVFAINNIIRTPGNEYTDHIGSLSLRYSFSKFREINMQGNHYSTEKGKWFHKLTYYTSRRYFGDLFVRTNEKESDEVFEKRCYAYLCLIGHMRQALMHGELSLHSQLYTLDQQFDHLHRNSKFRPDARKILFSFYNSRVNDINCNFLRLANKDLALLNMAYHADNNVDKEKIIAEYADYVIKQKYKNLGISLQKLRQSLVSVYLNGLSSEKYDSVRKRLYRLINFTIYRYYVNNQQDADQFIVKLRSSMSVKEKNALYVEEAIRIWPHLKEPVETSIVNNIMKISKCNQMHTEISNSPAQVITPDGNCFCQLLLLLSQFLDSTEANEMISYLIDKLESIQDLLWIMHSQNITATFTAPYVVFNDSNIMADNLREINSFSHMNSQKAYLSINLRKLYFDAARIFGYDGPDQALEKYIDSHLIYCKSGKKDNMFRSFLNKHIINLPSFGYLARYGNMDKIKVLMNNPEIVRFVLETFTKEELHAYSNLFENAKVKSSEEIRGLLNSRIMKISLYEFESIEDNQMIKKNLARLYLEILYRLIKNLVEVNSRYALAFHCVERDAAIYYSDSFAKEMCNKKEFASFASQYLQDNWKNDLVHQQIRQNLLNSDPWSIRNFRNCVAHLGAIRNANLYIDGVKKVTSYFALYHYLVQRYLLDQFSLEFYDVTHPPKSERRTYYYLHFAVENGTYNKDYVKAVSIPFSYNLARYKNLTVESLFDKSK